MYIILNISNDKYLAANGEVGKYVDRLEDAAVWTTKAAALETGLSKDERVVAVADLLALMGSPADYIRG